MEKGGKVALWDGQLQVSMWHPLSMLVAEARMTLEFTDYAGLICKFQGPADGGCTEKEDGSRCHTHSSPPRPPSRCLPALGHGYNSLSLLCDFFHLSTKCRGCNVMKEE